MPMASAMSRKRFMVANDVEFFNIWQEDGVADAVWQVVVTAELVGHCMDIAEGGVVERDTGEVLCIGHFIAARM